MEKNKVDIAFEFWVHIAKEVESNGNLFCNSILFLFERNHIERHIKRKVVHNDTTR